MKRGDVVAVAIPGDYGKPRPAVVVQSNLFEQHPSVTVLPITSEPRHAPIFRIDLLPDSSNGLRSPSQVMVDKIQTVARRKVGPIIGVVGEPAMASIDRALAVFLGIA
ncbi:MAG: type II toxin-antitoxin system PemK/MazF family toxin [Burkholderiaceae bacterium]|nr:type II toxin-antitoxin system PemK/MazF family toxin [Burkholderiaceae bacterium]